MKTLKMSVWTIVLTSLFAMTAKGQSNTHKGEPNLLFNKWYLKKYVAEGQNYPTEKKEKGDYLLLKEDFTFSSKSEGKEEKGKYLLNTNGGYILMIDKKGEKVKVYITSLSKQSLILKYDLDEIKDIEVHYSSLVK